jgi:kynureninase
MAASHSDYLQRRFGSRADARAADAGDALAAYRERFLMPDGVIYLDGNSLGPLPLAARDRIRAALDDEWGALLIKGWNDAGWMALPRALGAQIASLIGANAHEVVCADSTSVNVFKALSAAIALRPGRHVVLSSVDNFPTDLYIAQGLLAQMGGGHTLKLVDAAEIANHIDDDTAVVMLTHVDYKSGAIFDMPALTAAAHSQGALTIWDLAHTAGALPVDVNAAHADFAVGCGYKYLNGGPGAPAFVFVADRHQSAARQPLSGWLGHARPFAFEPGYDPAPGVDRFVCGTPPVLSMTALSCGVAIVCEAGMPALREKSKRLTDLFVARVEATCVGYGLALVSPRDADARGSQVSFRHPDGYAIMQALIADGVIGDFRAPDILRFGFAPLYVRYVDAWDAADVLADVLAHRRWDRPEFKARKAVT